MLDARATTEYIGHSGVFDLMAELGLTMDQALDVSSLKEVGLSSGISRFFVPRLSWDGTYTLRRSQ